MFYVHVAWDGAAVMGHTLERGLVTVGRSPTNRIVLPDHEVGWHHCMFWAENGQPWLRDVGSPGGTWVDGVRIEGPALLAPASVIRIGQHVELGVRPIGAPAVRRTKWVLRDVASGVAIDVTAALEAQAGEAVLVLHHTRPPVRVSRIEQGLRLEADRRAIILTPGAPVSVAGQTWRIDDVEVEPDGDLTMAPQPCDVWWSTQDTGAVCVIRSGLVELTWSKNSRALLVALLAERWLLDASGREADARGWYPIDQLLGRIWGRHGSENNLAVLLHRVRTDLRAAGLSPALLQRSGEALRLDARAVRRGVPDEITAKESSF